MLSTTGAFSGVDALVSVRARRAVGAEAFFLDFFFDLAGVFAAFAVAAAACFTTLAVFRLLTGFAFFTGFVVGMGMATIRVAADDAGG